MSKKSRKKSAKQKKKSNFFKVVRDTFRTIQDIFLDLSRQVVPTFSRKLSKICPKICSRKMSQTIFPKCIRPKLVFCHQFWTIFGFSFFIDFLTDFCLEFLGQTPSLISPLGRVLYIFHAPSATSQVVLHIATYRSLEKCIPQHPTSPDNINLPLKAKIAAFKSNIGKKSVKFAQNRPPPNEKIAQKYWKNTKITGPNG